MPSLEDVKVSNAQYAPLYVPTAIFIGGTSGIGQAMAELLAWRTNGRANIIIIGRNKVAADKIIASFPSPPPGEDGSMIKHEFIECDAAELKNVHETAQELLKRLDKINILVLCAATVEFSPHETSEGLERSMVLRYYSRAKFSHELMPLLTNARAKGEDAKVMTILGAAMGGRVDLTDLGVKMSWGVRKMAYHTGTFNDILVKVCPSPSSVKLTLYLALPLPCFPGAERTTR
jgi:NAD(P)-dependent dehydrogenase (short-subunit alcohol dehydrogenase family)